MRLVAIRAWELVRIREPTVKMFELELMGEKNMGFLQLLLVPPTCFERM